MAKRQVYTVSKRSSKPGWKVKKGGKTVVKADTKAQGVKGASKVARKQNRASVVIRKTDGRIQEERTYPRSSDPSRSKG